LTHTAAIRSDGYLFTWGGNSSGQLGTTVLTDLLSWTAVSAGRSHTAAIRSDGYLFTWGINSGGRLGDGTTTAKNSPVNF
jgi:alpha-tubulin suppressor-like RCC1 family protein